MGCELRSVILAQSLAGVRACQAVRGGLGLGHGATPDRSPDRRKLTICYKINIRGKCIGS